MYKATSECNIYFLATPLERNNCCCFCCCYLKSTVVHQWLDVSSYLRRPSEADFLSPLDCTILCNWRENNQSRKCHLNMPHSTTQHSTTQNNTTHHTKPQYNTIQYIQYNTSQHSTTQHNTTPYNATQRNTTQKEQQLTNINRRNRFSTALLI